MLEGVTLQLHGRYMCMYVHMCVGGHYVPFVLSFNFLISLEDIEMLKYIMWSETIFRKFLKNRKMVHKSFQRKHEKHEFSVLQHAF